VVNVRVEYGGWAVIPPGSIWYYQDGGVDLGTEWSGTNVDVSAWPQGPAKLGFGDDDVVTAVNWLNPANGEVYPTYYFRRPFNLPDPLGHSNFVVRLRRDDGAIVYLNSEEIIRDNMPESEVDYRTYAARNIPDETEFAQYWINRARLRSGINYLAVEIHNSGPQSHDVGFDLALVADVPLPPPQLTIQRLATNVVVSWPAAYGGFKLDCASTLDGASEWQSCPFVSLGTQFTHTNSVNGTPRFFRLRLQ
jgi:hypothetical protein